MANEIISRSNAKAQGVFCRYRRYRLRHPEKVKAKNAIGSAKQRALRKQKAAEEGRIIWQHVSLEERLNNRRAAARKRYHAKSLEKKRLERAKYKWKGAKAYQLKWARANPERVIAKVHKRRSAKLKSRGSFTNYDLAWIMRAQNGKCAYCRFSLSKRKKHVDHILPLSCGGSNDRTNIQYLCAPCNLTKGAKDPILFAQELGRLL
jgi:5-methylcytosine-specific restriction endonuclease McrA